MKSILYIANARIPTEKAHSLQIMKTCESFARNGVSVDLVVPNRKNNIKEDAFNFYKVESNFKITKTSCIDFLENNIIPKLFSFWIQSITFYFSAKKYIKQNPDSIYYTRDLLIAGLLPKKVGSVFYEVHTVPDSVNFIYKRAWNNSKGLVVISEGIKKELIRLGVAENKITISRDAVDIEQFNISETKEESRNKLNLPQDKKIIVYTGHLYDWKGAHILAEAASNINEVEFYFVGGTEKDISFFKENFTSKNIHIMGHQKHETIPYWLRAADFLVLPNSAKKRIGALFTSPLKLFEYMASKTPIISSRVPAIEEVLNDNEVYYFEPDNVEDLERIIKENISNTESSNNKAKASFEKVQKYSWNNRAVGIIKYIQSI